MLMLEYRDIGWWYWLVTAILLSIGLLVDANAFLYAIGLTCVQLLHYGALKGLRAFPVQVRGCYLLLLLLALAKPMQWLYWIPCIGTWAQIVFGYCAMARLVSLLPWNREQPLSGSLLRKTFFSRPVRGSVKQGFAESQS